jgi:hypothetical protein
LQYARPTGTGNFRLNFAQLTPLSGSIGAEQYLLIQEDLGAGGITALPTPDITDATPINISLSGAKVALANTSVSLWLQRRIHTVFGRCARFHLPAFSR